MNNVNLIGRLTKDPQLAYIPETQNAVVQFTLAIDRGKTKEGKGLGADFIQCKAYGKIAEVIEKYVKKGHLFGVHGRIKTGKYDKDGQTHYTTDVIVQGFDFLQGKKESQGEYNPAEDYEQVNESTPF